MIEHGVTVRALAGFLSGALRADDTYRLALYDGERAELGPGTRQYTTVGEVRGSGYTAGGIVVQGWTVGEDRFGAWITFDNVEWPRASVEADGGLVYHEETKMAVFVLNFRRRVLSSNAMYRVRIPGPGTRSALFAIPVR